MDAKTLIERYNLPDDIATLSLEEKYVLAKAVRERIIEVVAKQGGHLASSLGTVELTIALLSQMNFLHDRIVWDVGHQAYPWKILTGRNIAFETLRSYKGIAGFLTPTESVYDHFGAGHASTSISAALGIALAQKNTTDTTHNVQEPHVVAVIGDGSLTGGLALEALNQIASTGVKLIVLLNDNTFSISGNVGSLSRFISRTFSAHTLRKIKEGIKSSVGNIAEGKVLDYLRKGERSVKGLFTPGMLFEALQINYIGPIDGHDIESLEQHIAIAKEQSRSVLLHIATQKGKGFIPAEENPIQYHGVAPFTVEDGTVIFQKKGSIPTYTSVFSQTMLALLAEDSRINVITAAMPEGTGVSKLIKDFPQQCFDVGICEPHAVTMAAGMAIEGKKPYVAIYSTFLQRAYDQIIHDVCLQNLPVVFCIDRAGIVGEDGATHQGVFDIAFLRSIPNMHILVPRDENILQHALYSALQYNVPCAIRYERGTGIGVPLDTSFKLLPIGQGEILLQGSDVLVIGVGSLLYTLKEILEEFATEYNVFWTLFDLRWVKPLPYNLAELFAHHSTIVCVEEGVLAGGVSSALCEWMADSNIYKRFIRLGVQDSFVEHGDKASVMREIGLDKTTLIQKLKALL